MSIRKWLFLFGAFALLGGALIAADNDPFVGTWKLDVNKSTYSNIPKPKELTLTVTNDGTNQVLTFNGTAADGSPITGQISAPMNGGSMNLAKAPMRNTAYDSAVLKKINSRTEGIVYSKDGKKVATRHVRVASDGKTLTARYAGPNSQGETVTQNDVWHKQ